VLLTRCSLRTRLGYQIDSVRDQVLDPGDPDTVFSKVNWKGWKDENGYSTTWEREEESQRAEWDKFARKTVVKILRPERMRTSILRSYKPDNVQYIYDNNRRYEERERLPARTEGFVPRNERERSIELGEPSPQRNQASSSKMPARQNSKRKRLPSPDLLDYDEEPPEILRPRGLHKGSGSGHRVAVCTQSPRLGISLMGGLQKRPFSGIDVDDLPSFSRVCRFLICTLPSLTPSSRPPLTNRTLERRFHLRQPRRSLRLPPLPLLQQHRVARHQAFPLKQVGSGDNQPLANFLNRGRPSSARWTRRSLQSLCAMKLTTRNFRICLRTSNTWRRAIRSTSRTGVCRDLCRREF